MKDIKNTASSDRIRVYKYATDKFKSESISVYFAVPTVKEKSVVRSLLLSVLKRGSERYPSQRLINERLDELYATLVDIKNQKFEGLQLLGFSADMIRSSYIDDKTDLLPEALEIISQMLLYPLTDVKTGMLCEEYLESEKENYKSIILSQINEPRTYAAIRCREETFASLGVIDTLDTMCDRIDAVSARELYDCYCEIRDTAKIFVFYVGERSDGELNELVFDTFGSELGKQSLKNERAARRFEAACEPRNIVEDMDVSQSRLVMSFHCGATWKDEDYYAMLLFNEILGASPISKLMINVREKLSLCYECSSVYNSARGAIFVTTGIDRESYELAMSAIIEQINDIKQGKITQAELDAAKKSISNVYSSICDSPDAIERFYLGRLINGIDVDVSDFLSKIDGLDASDVVCAAKKLSLHTVYFLRGNESGEGEALYE